jgi:molecular chaperone DnaJ
MNDRVSEVLRRVCREQKTGVLVGEATDWKRAVFFRSGAIVAARSSLKRDQLGEVLIQHGRITKEHFEEAARSIKSGRRLGAILIDMGVIDKTEIERFVRLQITDIVSALLIDPPRRIAFSALGEVDGVLSEPLQVVPLLMETARRTPDIARHRETILQEERCLAVSPNPMTSPKNLSLALEEKMLFARIDGTRTASALLPLSPLPEEATLRFLLGLLHAGIVVPNDGARRQQEAEGAQTSSGESTASADPSATEHADSGADAKVRDAIERAYQQSQSQNYWEVLGVVQGASPEGVKQAFHQMIRRFHPDRLNQIQDGALKQKASHIVQRAGEAFDALTTATDASATPDASDLAGAPTESPNVRGAPDLAKKDAREFYLRAKMAYDQEDYWNAVQLCREAIDRSGDVAEYYYLLGLALSQNSKWRKDAEQNLRIATKLDPWKVKYFAALGELYLNAGMRTRARNVFEQARAIDPGFVPPDAK